MNDEGNRARSRLEAALLAQGLDSRILFGAEDPRRKSRRTGAEQIFLDGASASFILTHREEDPATSSAGSQLDWAWSCDVPHLVELPSRNQRDLPALVRRWDNPMRTIAYDIKSIESDCARFIRNISRIESPLGSSVIQFAIDLFRLTREVLRLETEQSLSAFTFLLRCTAAIRHASEDHVASFLSAERLQDIARVSNIETPPGINPNTRMASLQQRFMDRDRATGRTLDPHLLLRHASGSLFQEAHLWIERSGQLSLFAPMSAVKRGKQLVPHAVYTPPGLARLLVKLAWHYHQSQVNQSRVVVFDPACGSGVFLIESLLGAPSSTRLSLIGWDISPAAVTMARTVLRSQSSDSVVEISQFDSLENDWPECDIVLMNPPFTAWEDQPISTRQLVRKTVGTTQGRPDLAMAFVTKAVTCLRPGGVLCTILPSAVLGAHGARSWREGLMAGASIRLIARFQGNELFPQAMIEPSALVLQKKIGCPSASSVTVAFAAAGFSDAAIRALRVGHRPEGDTGKYEVFETPESDWTSTSWMPRSRSMKILIDRLSLKNPSVSSVFNVRQGIRSGADRVFVISDDERKHLSTSEREYFRPLAGSRTINNGQLRREEYIFFPYDESGLRLNSEKSLLQNVPEYYALRLRHSKEVLQARQRLVGHWWELMWARNWQYSRESKLISAYYGRQGKFCLDSRGDAVVGQGYAWLFRDRNGLTQPELAKHCGLAYLAILCSSRFVQVLGAFSRVLLGGQFEYSKQYADRVPIPDLITPGAVGKGVFEELTLQGKRICESGLADNETEVNAWTELAYGVDNRLWPENPQE